jgi:hypothetical protein
MWSNRPQNWIYPLTNSFRVINRREILIEHKTQIINTSHNPGGLCLRVEWYRGRTFLRSSIPTWWIWRLCHTDGSKTEGLVGFGKFLDDRDSYRFKLPGHCGIFTAEMCAIHFANDLIESSYKMRTLFLQIALPLLRDWDRPEYPI